MNDKAITFIGLNLYGSVLINVLGETTMKNIWDKLASLYDAKSLMN